MWLWKGVGSEQAGVNVSTPFLDSSLQYSVVESNKMCGTVSLQSRYTLDTCR